MSRASGSDAAPGARKRAMSRPSRRFLRSWARSDKNFSTSTEGAFPAVMPDRLRPSRIVNKYGGFRTCGRVPISVIHPISAPQPSLQNGVIQEEPGMSYEPMDFSELLGMDGFSDELLEDHFKLYQG